MKYYDIYGIEIKDGDIIKMGDPLYGEIKSDYEIKKINGILHNRPVNYKNIPCYKDLDAWSPVDQRILDICEAEIKVRLNDKLTKKDETNYKVKNYKVKNYKIPKYG